MAEFDEDERKPAPEFEARDSDGHTHRLGDYRGQWLVVFFYPKAFTPGCTKQTMCFRDRSAEVAAFGAKVLGVSRDDEAVQRSFGQKLGVGFPLIADHDGAVSRAFGVARRLFSVAKRVTFVIDPQGRVAARFHHELQATRHVDDVLAFLKRHAAPV